MRGDVRRGRAQWREAPVRPDLQHEPGCAGDVDAGAFRRIGAADRHQFVALDRLLLKPRMPEELDETLGGGVVYRHAPHLIDTVRLLGGGRVRSVRASVGRWLAERPCPGNFSAYLEFEDGTPATIAYNGYGYFDTSELTWGIGNRMFSDAERVRVRHALRRGANSNEDAKEGLRFGAAASPPTARVGDSLDKPAVG